LQTGGLYDTITLLCKEDGRYSPGMACTIIVDSQNRYAVERLGELVDMNLQDAIAYVGQKMRESRDNPRCTMMAVSFTLAMGRGFERFQFLRNGGGQGRPALPMISNPVTVQSPTEAELVRRFTNRRSEDTITYKIDDYINPISTEAVRDRRRALFIQENVRDGMIHGLYDPEDLYRWFEVHGKTRSPRTRNPVRLPLRRLPAYLIGE
jgi:hypothetical protein